MLGMHDGRSESQGTGCPTPQAIVPACRACNTSKCNAEVTGWLRRRRLDESAFLLRHLEVRAELSARFS
jgi:hypothetical protein